MVYELEEQKELEMGGREKGLPRAEGGTWDSPGDVGPECMVGAGLGRAAEARLLAPEGHGEGFGICSKGSAQPLEGFQWAESFLSPGLTSQRLKNPLDIRGLSGKNKSGRKCLCFSCDMAG